MTEDPDNVVPLRPNDGRGDFFAIDRRAWAKACALGLNPAAAYVVLARGTGGDNRTTSWSVNAIEKYTGIARPRAQKAVQTLVTAGLVRMDKGGSRPRYHIVPAHEVPDPRQVLKPLSETEQDVLDVILAAGRCRVPMTSRYNVSEWGVENPHSVACDLARKGYVRQISKQIFEPVERESMDEEPDWLWLPNAIVDGADSETAPLERIRQSQNVAALRIFGDLYHAQDLMTEGGIDWHLGRGIRDEFERFKVGEHGPFAIWGFRCKTSRTAWETPFAAPHLDPSRGNQSAEAFWEAWRVLTSSGLVEMVAHLVEATTDEAEAIHPLAVDNGEEGERAIRTAAWNAARTMVTDGKYDWALEQGISILVPVRAHMADVQVVGIARLRYRPRTRATAIWHAKAAEWPEWVSRYEAMTGNSQQREYATSR